MSKPVACAIEIDCEDPDYIVNQVKTSSHTVHHEETGAKIGWLKEAYHLEQPSQNGNVLILAYANTVAALNRLLAWLRGLDGVRNLSASSRLAE